MASVGGRLAAVSFAGEAGRIALPLRAAVEHEGRQQHERDAHQDGRERVAEPERPHRLPSEHGDHRGRASRRMDRTQVSHRGHREARGDGRREHDRHIPAGAHRGDADDRRHQMPDDDVPRLRERSVRRREHQHRGRAERGHDPEAARRTDRAMGDGPDERDRENGAEAREPGHAMVRGLQFETQDPCGGFEPTPRQHGPAL